MSNFGTDFAGVSDLDATLRYETDPNRVLAEDLARVLQMKRGSLWYAPDRGYDVRELVADSNPDPSSAEQSIEAECLKDERVTACQCSVAVAGETWTITVKITASTGATFTLTLAVTSVTVEILSVVG